MQNEVPQAEFENAARSDESQTRLQDTFDHTGSPAGSTADEFLVGQVGKTNGSEIGLLPVAMPRGNRLCRLRGKIRVKVCSALPQLPVCDLYDC